MIADNILEAMGNTPLIRLNRMTDEDSAEVLVKFEGMNVGGSIKTRTAFAMIRKAEEQGLIGPDSVIVEPTSGNQGIGLALVGAVRGYKVRIIMPDSVSEERRKLIEHYGAEVILVHDDGNIGECINECVNIAMRMQKEDPAVYVPQQFENFANVEIQRLTGEEILKELGHPVDGFCSGIGTGGTLTGVGRYLKMQKADVRIVGVEPETSAVLSGGKAGPHRIQGIGAGFVPDVLDSSVYDEIIPVSDEDAFSFGRLVGKTEGVLAGISSGAALAAAVALARRPENEGKNIVVLFPDSGDRYISTELFEG